MGISKEQLKKNSRRIFGKDRTGRSIPAMVIDDEFVDRRILAQLLRSVGFDVLAESSNGVNGRNDFIRFRPKLVVLDMHMPGSSGLDALKDIKSIEPNVVVVMCTSDNRTETVQTLLTAGADDYSVKPIDRTQFLYKLEKLVLRKGLRN